MMWVDGALFVRTLNIVRLEFVLSRMQGEVR